MRIVHLSDIHLSSTNLKDLNFFSIKALIKDLKSFHEQKAIDLIFFTGDLIDQGGRSFKDIDTAFKTFEKNVISKLADELNLSKDRFIFTPGNHDIDRNADKETAENGLKYTLTNTEKVSEFIDSNDMNGIKRIVGYKNFEIEFHKDFDGKKSITYFESSYIVKIGGIKIGINALNTAWRCYDSDRDKGNILLGERQLFNGLEFIEGCDIKIALMHHSVDWLKDFERDLIFKFISAKYDMLFSGHVHCGSTWSYTNTFGNIFVSVASLNRSDNSRSRDIKYSNGYSIIDYIPENNQIMVSHRKYVHPKIDYVPNTEIANDLGIDNFYIQKESFKFSNRIKVEEITENNELVNPTYKDEKIMKTYLSNDNILDNKIIVKDKEIELFITNYIYLFREYIEKISNHSRVYKDISNDLDIIITLIDKIIIKSELVCSDMEVMSTIKNFGNLLEKLTMCNCDNDKLTVLNIIFKCITWWLRNLFEMFSIGQIESQYELDTIIDNILNEVKDNIDRSDEFIKLFISLKDTYNMLASKNIYEINKISDFSIISQAIVGIVFPLYLNIHDILVQFSEFEIGSYDDKEIKHLIEIVKNEYRNNDTKILGRENDVERLYKSCVENQFTVLRGESGSGKTTIISKIIKKISKEYFNREFSSAIIIHSFRHSTSLHESVKSIIEQCNIRLINKVCTKYLDEIYYDLNTTQENSDTYRKVNIYTNIYYVYKQYIKEVIQRMSHEYKAVYIILDSLDLIGQYEDKIEFLFSDIPKRSHILLSTSFNNECVSTLINNERIEKEIIELRNFSRAEMSIATGISEDYKEKHGKELNNKLFEKTKGNIRLINELMNEIRTEDGTYDISKLEYIDKNKIESFQSEADMWINSRFTFLEEILLLLAIFDSVCSLSLDKIQSFCVLKNTNIDYRE